MTAWYRRVALASAAIAAGAATPAWTQSAGLLAFGEPHQRVEVAPGRRINLFCIGEGSPTVVFTAGAASWSYVWARVQPAVAHTTRACSWDRAGNGFSDPSPEPQDVAHIAADLDRVLTGAQVTGPLILVGHSQGGLESLLFADRHPERVAGLVLVDPAFPDQAVRLRRAAPKLMAWSESGDRQVFAGVQACIDALKNGTAAGSHLPSDCAGQRRGTPAPFRAALAAWDRQAAYWETYLSDFVERDRNATETIDPRRTLGERPLVVFGSGVLRLSGAPAAVAEEIPSLQAEIARGHEELARLSTKGAYIPVPRAGHAIMLEKPDLVTEAILGMLAEVRSAPIAP